MNKKHIYLGYLKGLISSESTDPVFEFVLPVLYDNQEFLKTVYDSYIFRHHTVEEVEKMIRAKFPISQKKFKSLPEDIAHSLRWALYGVQNGFYEYKRLEYKQLIEEKKSFYVPIPILNDHLGTVNIDLVSLPNDLVDYIHKGKAKVIIYQDSEGFLYKDSDIEWLNTFASKHNIKKDSLIVESANQKFKTICKDYERKYLIENKFTILPSTDFEDRPWFTKSPKNYPFELTHHYKTFFDYLDRKVHYAHNKKMMAVARRYSGERAAIFHKVQTTPLLKETTYSSLHNPYGNKKEDCIRYVEMLNLKNQRQVTNWLSKNFDFENGHSCDFTDHKENWASEINPHIHYDTLVNVVIETHQSPSKEIFFSEKTYRPFYTAQPFIIFGNPGSLKVLKEMGYKTFDKFWDESYDDDLPISERLEKLYSTMTYIAETPMEELNRLMEYFEPILRHNFNVLISSDRILSKQRLLFDGLYTQEDIYKETRRLI